MESDDVEANVERELLSSELRLVESSNRSFRERLRGWSWIGGGEDRGSGKVGRTGTVATAGNEEEEM